MHTNRLQRARRRSHRNHDLRYQPASQFKLKPMTQEKEKDAYNEGDLKQATKLVLILYARLRMHESTLVGERTVRSDKDVIRDSLAEDLDLEYIRNNLFGLAVDIWVYECNIIVARDYISQGTETFLDTLDGDGIREGVAKVLELLVCRSRWDEQAVPVARCETSDDAGAADGGVHNRDHVPELSLKSGVEVCAALDGA